MIGIDATDGQLLQWGLFSDLVTIQIQLNYLKYRRFLGTPFSQYKDQL